jgi:hypothetical protein
MQIIDTNPRSAHNRNCKKLFNLREKKINNTKPISLLYRFKNARILIYVPKGVGERMTSKSIKCLLPSRLVPQSCTRFNFDHD